MLGPSAGGKLIWAGGWGVTVQVDEKQSYRLLIASKNKRYMECYATYLNLSFGFCFCFPVWLFFNFLISCLAILCPPVCKPEAIGHRIAIRAKVVQEGTLEN